MKATRHNARGEEKPTDYDHGPDLDERGERALTEYLTVLEDVGRARGAEDLYLVVSQSGSEYLVDARSGACGCKDAEYNLGPDERCKHARRVAFATGAEAIPAGVDGVDDSLGAHVAGTPRVAAADGGATVEKEESDESTGSDAEEHGRPEECDCWDADSPLPCWPCYRDGFTAPNPEEPGAPEEDTQEDSDGDRERSVNLGAGQGP